MMFQSLNWNSSSDVLASTFQQFLLELVASHNYYTKPVLENLLKRLIGMFLNTHVVVNSM